MLCLMDTCRSRWRAFRHIVDEGLSDVRHKSFKISLECETSSIPGISELRCEDMEICGRRLWEGRRHHKHHVHPGHQHHLSRSHTRRGVDSLRDVAPQVERIVIRFGSPVEKRIYGVMQALALFDLLMVPYVAIFDFMGMLTQRWSYQVIDFTVTLIYALGVCLRFRTTYINSTKVTEVNDVREIKAHVLRDIYFWADALALFFTPCLYVPGPISGLGHIRLLKCWRLRQNSERTMLLHFANNIASQRLLHITLCLFVAGHLYACAWFSVRLYGFWSGKHIDVCYGDSGGVPIADVTPESYPICYMYALHDSVSMLIGWGCPDPFTDYEVSMQIAIGLLNGCAMAYIYGLFVAAVSFASILEERFCERTAILSAACDNMHLPASLRFRVCRYHSYLAMNFMGHDSQELFGQLSVNLLSEVRVFRLREAIVGANFFKGLSPRLIFLLLSTCTEQVFSPGDMIIRKGEIGDCMYIIVRGHVAVLIDDDAHYWVHTLHKNHCFGELSLLEGRTTRNAWIRAEAFVVLSRLDKDRFDKLLGRDEKTLILRRLAVHLHHLHEKNCKEPVTPCMSGTRSVRSAFAGVDDADQCSQESSVSPPSSETDSDDWEPPETSPLRALSCDGLMYEVKRSRTMGTLTAPLLLAQDEPEIPMSQSKSEVTQRVHSKETVESCTDTKWRRRSLPIGGPTSDAIRNRAIFLASSPHHIDASGLVSPRHKLHKHSKGSELTDEGHFSRCVSSPTNAKKSDSRQRLNTESLLAQIDDVNGKLDMQMEKVKTVLEKLDRFEQTEEVRNQQMDRIEVLLTRLSSSLQLDPGTGYSSHEHAVVSACPYEIEI